MIKDRSGKKGKFIRELTENPLVERVCRRMNISRATFYRWCEEDPNFKIDVGKAQEKGRDKFNDFAESKLLENINANNYSAIAFWLKHNSKIYRPPLLKPSLEENDQYKEEVEKQWKLINELINIIGIDEVLRMCGVTDPEAFKAKYLNNQSRL